MPPHKQTRIVVRIFSGYLYNSNERSVEKGRDDVERDIMRQKSGSSELVVRPLSPFFMRGCIWISFRQGDVLCYRWPFQGK